MACKKPIRGKKSLLATLAVDQKGPCAFCQREVDDEITFGKLYAIGDIYCHYFCALLSCCLVQKGKDNEGLFGFLYHDILAEVERSKKHRCSYCGKGGAGLGCCMSQCRKQFHLPCGRERDAVSLFYGTYKSYCKQHAPKQKIPDHIMALARQRMRNTKLAAKPATSFAHLKELQDSLNANAPQKTEEDPESVCVICYETVDGYPTLQTFWPPCCARDAWFHRTCLQRMALSAGMHYLKCPLCNDKEVFHDAVVSQGYYVPDRDAAWELEQNAFAEIYERPLRCNVPLCKCGIGRDHLTDMGPWEIKLCILCGTSGCHVECMESASRFVCTVCKPAAPDDLETLATSIEAVIASEQAQDRQSARRPVMPSRMSLRRTKARIACNTPSTSHIDSSGQSDSQDQKSISSSRLELNIKSPRKPNTKPLRIKSIDNNLFSPTKIIEEGVNRKIKCMGVGYVDSNDVISKVKEKLKRPRPLSEKKRIVNTALEELFDDILKAARKSDKCSPKKHCDINNDEKTLQENELQIIQESQEPTINLELPIYSPEKLPTSQTKNLPPTEETQDCFNNEKDEHQGEFIKHEDDSSNSTFQLPPEFIAENNSDDSLPIFETPKKLKTVDIQKNSSLEISENDEVVNIDVIKMEEKASNTNLLENLKLSIPLKVLSDKCSFKFNPIDKETLQESDLNIDMESFKNQYLNEVDRDFKCSFSHKHKHANVQESPGKLRTAIDFAIDASLKKNKSVKRKMASKDGSGGKRRKLKNKSDQKENSKLKLVYSNNKKQTLNLTVEGEKKKKRSKKNKKARENIQVKIRFREEQLSLKITKSKNKKIKKQKPKEFKQYILQYSINSSPSKVLTKPDHDVTPKKRNYVKFEKSPDNLVQTSIQSFFKKVPVSDPKI